MRKFLHRNEQGFTAIELLITLFVAAAFLVAGYQLYFIVIKDNGQTRDQSRAVNVAYNYLRQYSGAASNPCSSGSILPSTSISVANLTNVHVSVSTSCPYSTSTGTNNATSITAVTVTVTYGSPLQTVQEVSYIHDTSSQPSPVGPATVTVTGNSVSQVTATWTAPSGYTPDSYNLIYSTNSNLSGGTQVNGLTGTSYAISGLSTSTQYYVGVQAASYQGLSQTTIASGATYNNWGSYVLMTGVGDWNGDTYNDLVGLKADGTLELHLGNGNGTFGPAHVLANIGTNIKSLIGPGTLPGGTTPVIWWYNTTGTGYFLTSNGATGVTGSAVQSGSSSTFWSSCASVFAVPLWVPGQTTIICETSALTEYSLSSVGVPSLYTTYGSGWIASFPGNDAFGAGDYVGNDGKGDIGGITTAGNCNTYQGLGNGTVNAGTNSCGSGWTNNPIVIGGWDYNGDGKVDILRYYTPTPALCLYEGNGAGGLAAGGSCSIVVN